jgi:hypothetical protein
MLLHGSCFLPKTWITRNSKVTHLFCPLPQRLGDVQHGSTSPNTLTALEESTKSSNLVSIRPIKEKKTSNIGVYYLSSLPIRSSDFCVVNYFHSTQKRIILKSYRFLFSKINSFGDFLSNFWRKNSFFFLALDWDTIWILGGQFVLC